MVLNTKTWIIIILAIVALSVMPVDGHTVKTDNVISQLEKSYTHVVVSDKQVNWVLSLHGCSRDDVASYQFTAQNLSGQTVFGTACVHAYNHKVFASIK